MAALEQTASGLFPSLLYQRRAAQSVGIAGDSDEKRRAAWTSVFPDCCICSVTMWICPWDKEGPEEYWLTAYAMDFLVSR